MEDPEDRIPTALEMQRALEQAMFDVGEQTSTADVADFMMAHLGDRIDARHRVVEQAVTAARERARHMRGDGSGSGVSSP